MQIKSENEVNITAEQLGQLRVYYMTKKTVVILSGHGKDSTILPVQMFQGVDQSDGDLHLLSSYFENLDVCNLIALGHQYSCCDIM